MSKGPPPRRWRGVEVEVEVGVLGVGGLLLMMGEVGMEVWGGGLGAEGFG